jgi:nucleoside-diphosphate-sugar epimerase
MTYGEARTIGGMAEILKDHFEGIKINYIPKDSLTPDRGTLNVDKARDLLGYQPQYPIDTGYLKYIQWYKTFWESMKK